MNEEYEPSTYGDRIAGEYDDLVRQTDERMIAVLTELAAGSRALELCIGTGRVALPLASGGVRVEGIDASAAMVGLLRSKPGGDRIPVTIGSFRQLEVEGQFSLVFVVFNTFFALLTQEEQVDCFQSVAEHLAPGGIFLIEAFVPDLSRYARAQNVSFADAGPDEVMLDLSRLDLPHQRIRAEHVVLSEAGVKLYPVELRFAWPSELDLMARIAGLRLRDRWAGWGKEPFTAASTAHVSVYTKE